MYYYAIFQIQNQYKGTLSFVNILILTNIYLTIAAIRSTCTEVSVKRDEERPATQNHE